MDVFHYLTRNLFNTLYRFTIETETNKQFIYLDLTIIMVNNLTTK